VTRMAVVGVGSMGRNHVRVLMDLPDVEVVGLADPDTEAAGEVARKYRLPLYADDRQLFDERTPEAVVIAVPTVHHREAVLAAFDRGIHVLVEKPIAASVRDAEELIAAAERNKLVLGVGHIERFNPAVIELKRRMDAGELGRVFMIHARRQSPYPKRIQDVGVASDLATHELDMMRYLTGSKVTSVSAEILKVMQSNREDSIFGLLRFDNGVLGVLDVNWITPTTVRELTITGSRGMFVVNYHAQELAFFENPAALVPANATNWMIGRDFTVDAGHMTRFQIARREPLRSELESFVHCVRTGQRPLVTGEDGLHALRLALDILADGERRLAGA